jgi:hypothetical protein
MKDKALNSWENPSAQLKINKIFLINMQKRRRRMKKKMMIMNEILIQKKMN